MVSGVFRRVTYITLFLFSNQWAKFVALWVSVLIYLSASF